MKRKLVYEESAEKTSPKKKCWEGDNSKQELIDFEPIHFLRCHSRQNDSADVQTQVWQCAFEPNTSAARRNTELVATCGGNSVCLIDVRTGVVKGKYYSEDLSELFYTLCWTSIKRNWMGAVRENILAVGGAKSTIHLIHPKNNVTFFKHKIKQSKITVISSLLFHPTKPNILFCACSNGNTTIWDIGSPISPDYTTKFTQLHVLCAKSEIFNLAFSVETDILLAAYNEGLCGWRITSTEIEKKSKKPQLLEFVMPKKSNNDIMNTGPQLVDSIDIVGNGIVATKCALHGNIYLWNLKDALNKPKGHTKSFQVMPLHVLRWSNTDNYFMNIGSNSDAELLVCGDDEGTLWLYNLKIILQHCPTDGKKQIDPTLKLKWPEVEDVYTERKCKLRLDVYDIVVDKVVVDCDGKYLVAVTNNNMVCIWRRINSRD